MVIFLFLTLTSIEAQTKSEKKAQKEEKAMNDYAASKKMIEAGRYSYMANWATTSKGRRIDLHSNPNFLKIMKDSADIFLPFFGTVHSASIGFGGNNAIEFKGLIENLKVEFNDKKRKTIIKFRGLGKSEQFNFILTVQRSGGANVSVTSSIRDGISYDGNIMVLEK